MYEILQTPEFSEGWTGWILRPQTVFSEFLTVWRKAIGESISLLPAHQGVFERRLMGRGPGIRLYFCRLGGNLALFLTGGDKASQQRSDIALARRLHERYE